MAELAHLTRFGCFTVTFAGAVKQTTDRYTIKIVYLSEVY